MAPLKLALLGYGRMGTEIESIALERGHTIIMRARRSAPALPEQLQDAEVALDFSSSEAVHTHIELCREAAVPLVIGTTGWSAAEEDLHLSAQQAAILLGANFSLGIAIVVKLAQQLAGLLAPALGYHLHVHEIHHRFKRDHPSGTALLLARILAQNKPRGAHVLTELGNQLLELDTMTISSSRVGSITGIHTVIADSDADTIEIVHRAKSRRGFALGAVLAAEWLVGRKGLFHFEDVAFEIICSASEHQ